MNWKNVFKMNWQCGRCNIVTKGNEHGEIKINGKWKPMCKSCGNEMCQIGRIVYPEYEW